MSIFIVLASGGISLYQHYCLCADTSKIAVFAVDINYDSSSNMHCCELDEPAETIACCSGESKSNPEDNACHSDHNCCNTTYKFLAVDEFDVVKSAVIDFRFVKAFSKTLEYNIDEEISPDLEFSYQNTSLPPPKYGKDLVISFQQIKIPFSLV